ncbi:hypothetical protein BN77_p11430 [Rhizobium mesoamericanum STM3625]|uniref:Uncharacterized protein n=1 Tax=Rhizobium mesoamericanum STM3625 TaxID=1211777 RepID=K0PQ63_9HYPH|nr:hypothetical protein BN77_p11430 [Rhizobium mesoamericanum STM3625]
MSTTFEQSAGLSYCPASETSMSVSLASTAQLPFKPVFSRNEHTASARSRPLPSSDATGDPAATTTASIRDMKDLIVLSMEGGLDTGCHDVLEPPSSFQEMKDQRDIGLESEWGRGQKSETEE